MKSVRPAGSVVLIMASAASGVAAWLNFRASHEEALIRAGKGSTPFDPHYPDIRLAWIVAIAAAAIGASLLLFPRASRGPIVAALLIAISVALVVASLLVSPAHFVAGTPRPVRMDPNRFDVAAWLSLAAAAGFLVIAIVGLARRRTR